MDHKFNDINIFTAISASDSVHSVVNLIIRVVIRENSEIKFSYRMLSCFDADLHNEVTMNVMMISLCNVRKSI